MTEAKQKEADQLHMELERLVLKLKHNREKVPLDVLKTKYAAGYTALSQIGRASCRERVFGLV